MSECLFVRVDFMAATYHATLLARKEAYLVLEGSAITIYIKFSAECQRSPKILNRLFLLSFYSYSDRLIDITEASTHRVCLRMS